NFNGGTLKARLDNATFMQGLNGAYVYTNGAVIDSAGFNITIAQNLAPATGYGLTNITVLNGGSGYIGAPYVQIIGGGGSNATAVAQIDSDPNSPTYGSVTNVVITSAGTGYTSAPIIGFIGGGAVMPASPGLAMLGTNVGGGLTKVGSGVLTLSGTNTYTGPTIINAGVLQIGGNGSLASDVTNNSALFFNPPAGITNLFGNFIAGTGYIAQVGAGVTVLTNVNAYSGSTLISNGVLRATDGVGISTASNLVLNGGVFETDTDFTRYFGLSNNTVSVMGGAGFSAFGAAPVNVSLDGGTTLVWGSTFFAPTNLILNAASANTNVIFVNGLDFGGLNRTVSVYSVTAPAIMSGILTNGSLSKSGTGTLVLTGNNANYSNFINGGTLKIGANNTLWTNSFLSFGDNTNAPSGYGTLDLSDFSQTLGALSVQTTNRSATNSIVIGAGQQLTVLGNVIVGVDAKSGPQST
ncbi:MAG: autotransporter-associated beta strand repeat-containing protein, partial [Verrucomicrobiia bacterium]